MAHVDGREPFARLVEAARSGQRHQIPRSTRSGGREVQGPAGVAEDEQRGPQAKQIARTQNFPGVQRLADTGRLAQVAKRPGVAERLLQLTLVRGVQPLRGNPRRRASPEVSFERLAMDLSTERLGGRDTD